MTASTKAGIMFHFAFRPETGTNTGTRSGTRSGSGVVKRRSCCSGVRVARVVYVVAGIVLCEVPYWSGIWTHAPVPLLATSAEEE